MTSVQASEHLRKVIRKELREAFEVSEDWESFLANAVDRMDALITGAILQTLLEIKKERDALNVGEPHED